MKTWALVLSVLILAVVIFMSDCGKETVSTIEVIKTVVSKPKEIKIPVIVKDSFFIRDSFFYRDSFYVVDTLKEIYYKNLLKKLRSRIEELEYVVEFYERGTDSIPSITHSEYKDSIKTKDFTAFYQALVLGEMRSMRWGVKSHPKNSILTFGYAYSINRNYLELGYFHKSFYGGLGYDPFSNSPIFRAGYAFRF